jgi:hypothetical protein
VTRSENSLTTDLLSTMTVESRRQRCEDTADWPLTRRIRHDRLVVVMPWGGQPEGVTVAANE